MYVLTSIERSFKSRKMYIIHNSLTSMICIFNQYLQFTDAICPTNKLLTKKHMAMFVPTSIFSKFKGHYREPEGL